MVDQITPPLCSFRCVQRKNVRNATHDYETNFFQSHRGDAQQEEEE
jgi:hypothetical protein